MGLFFSQVPLVVSYYTKGTPYEEEVKGLRESCEKFKIEHHIEGVENRGSWEENCAYKPYFLREMMKKLQRPLLWIDADAVFYRPLPFHESMFADLAMPFSEKQESLLFSVYSGTVFINATAGGFKALDLWCYYSDKIREESPKAPAFMDQVSLRLVVLAKPSLSIEALPGTFCKVFDHDMKGVDKNNMIIEQRQASRRLKEKIVP